MLKKLLIFGGIMFLVALVVGGWFWRESIKEKQAQVEQKQQEEALQTKDNTTEVKKEDPARFVPEDGKLHPRNPRIVPISGKTTDWYEIPEIGVKFELNSQFAHNLIYAVQSYHTVSSGIQGLAVSFLSKESVVAGCDLNELAYGSDGALSILYTKDINELHDDDFFPSADPRRSEFKGRQFGDFYMFFTQSKESCIPLEYFINKSDSTSSPYKGEGVTFIDINNAVPINAD